MISCSREILESIEKIRKAAAKEPENLGHQVKLYVLPSLMQFKDNLPFKLTIDNFL